MGDCKWGAGKDSECFPGFGKTHILEPDFRGRVLPPLENKALPMNGWAGTGLWNLFETSLQIGQYGGGGLKISP